MARTNERPGWVVVTDADFANEIVFVCELETTAHRLAQGRGGQGANARVEEVILFNEDGKVYGPVTVQPVTEEDRARDDMQVRARAAIAKARSLGMTDPEIAALRTGTLPR